MKKIQKFFLLMLVVAGLQTQASFVSKIRLAGYRLTDACIGKLNNLTSATINNGMFFALESNSPKATCYFANRLKYCVDNNFSCYKLFRRRDNRGLSLMLIERNDSGTSSTIHSDEETRSLYDKTLNENRFNSIFCIVKERYLSHID